MARNSVTAIPPSPQPGKLQIYQQQCSVNLALENVILSCRQLQTIKTIPRNFFAHYANLAEELRTLINCKLAETMYPVEEKAARHLERLRLQWESRPYPKIKKRCQ